MLRQLRVLTEEEEGVRLKNTGCDTGVRQLTLSLLLVTVTVSCVSQLTCVTVSYV
jgi:hypothetical protein